MSHTLTLYRLQQIDGTIDKIQARLNDIQKFLDDNTELIQAKGDHANSETELAGIQKSLLTIETEVRNQKIKIEQAESSLYGGTVKNPKELQDLQKDIASLKRNLNNLEDKQLETMVAVDDAAEQTRKLRDILNLAIGRSLTNNQTLAGEREALLKEKANKSAEREAVVVTMPGDLLAVYEDLRKKRHGVAVVTILENSCGACGEGLTPAVKQSVKLSPHPVFCPSCGRILYAN